MPSPVEDAIAAAMAADAQPEGPVLTPDYEPMPVQDPVAAEFTWESAPPPGLVQPYNPAQWDPAVESIDMAPMGPGTQPPAGQPSSLPAPTFSSGQHANVSFSGITDAGRKQADAIYGGLRPPSVDDARYARDAAAIARDLEAQKSAVMETGRLEREHYGRLLDLHNTISDTNRGFADLEAQMAADTRAEGQRIKSEFSEQLAGIRAMNATTGNPLHSLSLGQGAALGGALFAQGMLATQGIKIDVSGQLDKWVDRSIQEHQQRIQNARSSASDTLHLYDLARQTSQDEWEARQRYRGYIAEAFKSQITAEAARFGSPMAMAKAAERGAMLDAEITKTGIAIADKREASMRAQFKDQLDLYKAKADAAHQKAMAGIGWRNSETERMKLLAKEEKPTGTAFPHPGLTKRDPNTGKIVAVMNLWGRDRNATDDQYKEASKLATEHVNNYAKVMTSTAKLRLLRPGAQNTWFDKYGPDWAAKLTSEERRTYSREVILAIQDARHAIAGAQLVGFEKKEWDDILANDSGWQDGSNFAAVEQFEGKFRDAYVSTMDSLPGLKLLPPEQRDWRPVFSDVDDSSARWEGAVVKAAPKKGPVAEAQKDAVRVGHNEVPEGGGYSPFYYRYMQATGDTRGSGRSVDDVSPAGVKTSPGQRNEIWSVDKLAAIAARPQAFVDGSTIDGKSTVSRQDIEETRTAALAAIRNLSHGVAPDGQRVPDPEVRDYARQVIQLFEGGWDNPDDLYKEFTSTAHPDE